MEYRAKPLLPKLPPQLNTILVVLGEFTLQANPILQDKLTLVLPI